MSEERNLEGMTVLELAEYAQQIVDAKYACDHLLTRAENDNRTNRGLLAAIRLVNCELGRISVMQQSATSAARVALEPVLETSTARPIHSTSRRICS